MKSSGELYNQYMAAKVTYEAMEQEEFQVRMYLHLKSHAEMLYNQYLETELKENKK